MFATNTDAPGGDLSKVLCYGKYKKDYPRRNQNLHGG